VNDTRESPSLRIIELLRGEGAVVSYHDAFVPELPKLGLTSVPLDAETLDGMDVAVVVTAHTGTDWRLVADAAPLVVDLRNVVPEQDGKIWTL
jgi:UDP-N-acetyl-D-glucosamine dehydrogenase